MSGPTAKAQGVPAIFLSADGPGRKMKFERGQFVFRQGDPSDGVYLILSGRVRLSVTNSVGRQATVALLDRNELFGEQCLVDVRNTRLISACTTDPTEVAKIGLQSVKNLLASDLQFANFILQSLLLRMAQYEQALVHQIIDNAERRLARALLHLCKYDSAKTGPTLIEGVSQEMLAEMVGASRPRINGFMTKFRRLGHLEYHGNHILVKPSLVSVLFQAREHATQQSSASEEFSTDRAQSQ